jgi:hypothetical protein
VALPRIPAQEIILRLFAAVKRPPVMLFADRLFVPVVQGRERPDSAAATLFNLAFGTGGFSNNG